MLPSLALPNSSLMPRAILSIMPSPALFIVLLIASSRGFVIRFIMLDGLNFIAFSNTPLILPSKPFRFVDVSVTSAHICSACPVIERSIAFAKPSLARLSPLYLPVFRVSDAKAPARLAILSIERSCAPISLIEASSRSLISLQLFFENQPFFCISMYERMFWLLSASPAVISCNTEIPLPVAFFLPNAPPISAPATAPMTAPQGPIEDPAFIPAIKPPAAPPSAPPVLAYVFALNSLSPKYPMPYPRAAPPNAEPAIYGAVPAELNCVAVRAPFTPVPKPYTP